MGTMYGKIRSEQSEKKICPKCHKALMKKVSNADGDHWWCMRCGYTERRRKNGK